MLRLLNLSLRSWERLLLRRCLEVRDFDELEELEEEVECLCLRLRPVDGKEKRYLSEIWMICFCWQSAWAFLNNYFTYFMAEI